MIIINVESCVQLESNGQKVNVTDSKFTHEYSYLFPAMILRFFVTVLPLFEHD